MLIPYPWKLERIRPNTENFDEADYVENEYLKRTQRSELEIYNESKCTEFLWHEIRLLKTKQLISGDL